MSIVSSDFMCEQISESPKSPLLHSSAQHLLNSHAASQEGESVISPRKKQADDGHQQRHSLANFFSSPILNKNKQKTTSTMIIDVIEEEEN